MSIPFAKNVPISKLAGCFNNTTATYKYYWLIAILQCVELGHTTIQKQNLFALMIANAWYPINYFHISFGIHDKLQRAVEELRQIEGINVDEKIDAIYKILSSTKKPESLVQLKYFNSQVPHWFLSPWYNQMNKSEIYEASQKLIEKPLYQLYENEIIILPEWQSYIVDNVKILKDYCYWNLALFLQSRNPNVPDIPNKLIKPAIRNSLTKQRKGYWDIVLKEFGTVNCIYTGKELSVGNYVVEHFVPYSFVSHDLIWNLIPADKSFNGFKSDKLPSMEKYFVPFYEMQKKGLETIRKIDSKNKFLEDYLTIFPTFESFIGLTDLEMQGKIRERIQPLITIASNNGYQFLH